MCGARNIDFEGKGETMTAKELRAAVRSLGEAARDFGADTDEDVFELAEAEVLYDCTPEEIADYERQYGSKLL